MKLFNQEYIALTANCQVSINLAQQTAAFQMSRGNKGFKKVTASATDLQSLPSSSLLPTGLVSPEYLHPAVVKGKQTQEYTIVTNELAQSCR